MAKEIEAEKFRALCARILNLSSETMRQAEWTLDSGFRVKVSSSGLHEPIRTSIQRLLNDYARLRSQGHSADYSHDSLQERLSPPEPETDPYRAKLFENFPNIPKRWLKTEPAELVIPGSPYLQVFREFVVIDGEIAWSYRVWLHAGPVVGIRVDAREYDPRFRPSFRAAQKQAEEALEKAGVRRGLGYHARLEAEMNEILIRDHGIKWRRFAELNPGIHFD